MKILNIVAFIILMQDKDNGIMNRSPDYIIEKYKRYILSDKEDEFMWGLDEPNKVKLNLWRLQWDEEYRHLKKLQQ